MHKHWVHEGGISTPFIAVYPEKIGAGRIYSEKAGHIIDLMPTFLAFAGGTYPENFNGNKITPMEGISLKSVLTGGKMERKQPLFWEHEGNRAMRNGDWKLVSQYDYRNRKFMSWELYNLKTDRSELTDLSSEKPDLKNKMIQEYEQWASRVGVISKEILDNKKK